VMKGGIEMNHNDRLTRLRYALDLRDAEMVTIFGLGGISLNEEDVQSLLKKTRNNNEDKGMENEYEMECSDEMLERFLNGLITSRRGAKDGPEPKNELNLAHANKLYVKK